MNIYLKLIVASAFLLSTPSSQAYEIATHDKLSLKTALCSVLGQDIFMKSIGWASILKNDDDDFKFKRVDLIQKTGTTLDLTTQELIGWGAQYEDDIASIKRPLNHFFDPLRNKPLRRTRKNKGVFTYSR